MHERYFGIHEGEGTSSGQGCFYFEMYGFESPCCCSHFRKTYGSTEAKCPFEDRNPHRKTHCCRGVVGGEQQGMERSRFRRITRRDSDFETNCC